MTETEFWIWMSLQILLCILITIASWICYRRTRILTIFLLGLFLAFLWPICGAALHGLLDAYEAKAAAGEAGEFLGMAPGIVIAKVGAAARLLRYGAIALLFALQARAAAKRLKPDHADC